MLVDYRVKEFLSEFEGTIKILDGTAEIMEDLYKLARYRSGKISQEKAIQT